MNSESKCTSISRIEDPVICPINYSALNSLSIKTFSLPKSTFFILILSFLQHNPPQEQHNGFLVSMGDAISFLPMMVLMKLTRLIYLLLDIFAHVNASKDSVSQVNVSARVSTLQALTRSDMIQTWHGHDFHLSDSRKVKIRCRRLTFFPCLYLCSVFLTYFQTTWVMLWQLRMHVFLTSSLNCQWENFLSQHTPWSQNEITLEWLKYEEWHKWFTVLCRHTQWKSCYSLWKWIYFLL